MVEFTTGGFTFAGTFKSEFRLTGNSQIGNPCPQSNIIIGEDGTRYYILGGVGGASGQGDQLIINDADTGLTVIDKTKAQLTTDIDAALGSALLDNLINGQFASNQGSLAITIPDSPYIIFVAGSAAGVDTSFAIIYAKMNSSSLLEIVAGWSGEEDGLDVQFRPQDAFGDSAYGAGHMMSDAFAVTGTNNTIAFKYPYTIALFGEGDSTYIVIPSINQIIAATTLIESGAADVWDDKENFLTVDYGVNIFNLQDSPSGTERNRAFFLPRASGAGSFVCQQFYLTDLEAHDAGTETTTNSFLDTNASTYVTGLISASPVAMGADILESFGFNSSIGSVIIPFHEKFENQDTTPAFPYPDSKENFDGSAGIAAENYYGNGTAVPSSTTDPTQPWFIFIPRLYRKAGDRDKIGVRIFAWNPVTEIASLLDFGNGQVFDIGTDVNADTEIDTANISWNRTTGDLTMLMHSSPAGAKALIVASVGTFIPVVKSTGATTSEELLVRAWTFPLDGHNFYVLRLGEQGTFIYDDLTQQWQEWLTEGSPTWNAEHGIGNWEGKPLAGDKSDASVWEVDANSFLDEDDKNITRCVTGIVPHRSKDPLTVAEARLMASVGAPDVPNASISLSFSDDQGNTFSQLYTVTLTSGDFDQVISFRSLGQIKAPGRIFEIQDVGGLTRIDGLEIDFGEE